MVQLQLQRKLLVEQKLVREDDAIAMRKKLAKIPRRMDSRAPKPRSEIL
jgi:hypothetical protein